MPRNFSEPVSGQSNWDAPLNGSLTNLDGRLQRLTYDVQEYGATGNGVTDDTSAIQSAINASTAGSIVYFPPGIYLVSSIITLLHSRTYQGAGRELSTVRMKNGANLDAVMASETWLSTVNTTADNPIYVCNLKIDGNNTGQTGGAGHCLALITFWNTLENLEVENARGNGILLTCKRRDGTQISNTPVENKVVRCAVRTTCQTLGTNGGAIHIEDPTASSNQHVTDGFVENCIIQNSNGYGIMIESSAGWSVTGNHLYGVQASGIWWNRGPYVRIIGNYIETYGSSSTAGTYAAIQCGGDGFAFIGNTAPNVIANNVAFYTSGAAVGTSIRGMAFDASSSINAHLVVVGNGLFGATATGGSQGIRFGNQSATGNMFAQVSGNMVFGWDTQFAYNPNGGTITVTGDVFQTGIATTSTDGFGRLPTCAGAPTGVPADTTNKGIPAIYDTTNHKLWVYDTAWKGVVLA